MHEAYHRALGEIFVCILRYIVVFLSTKMSIHEQDGSQHKAKENDQVGLLILMLGLAFLLFLLRNPLASCLFVVSTTLLECLCWQSKHVQHYYAFSHTF